MAKKISIRQRLERLPSLIRSALLILYIERGGKKLPADVKGQVLTQLNTQPKTVDFDSAVSAVERGHAAGIGLPFLSSGFSAADLDDCVEDGQIAPWAIHILRESDSYAEFSPSGTGIHILFAGTPDVPNARRVSVGMGHIDFFATNGFLTLTGRPVPGYANKPLRNGKVLMRQIFDRVQPFAEAIRRVRLDRKMRDLWLGNWEDHYDSQSEADLAFVGFVAPFLDYNRTLIEALVSQSGLNRRKWEREDYRKRTIDRALRDRRTPQSDDDLLLKGLVRISDEVAANVKWLMRHRIPFGFFSALAGEPAAGKGTTYSSLAAAVTRGARWPDGSGRAPQGKVVIFTNEDDIASVIKPRILAAGGDPSKVFVYRDLFTFKDNLGAFEKLLKELAPTWVILDPGKPYIGELRNAHDDAEIRRILDPVAKLLGKYGVACTLVYHLTKDEERAMGHRLLGSIAHVAYPRAVWAIGENPRDESERPVRGFMPIKNNLYDPRRVGGLEFRIESVDITVDGKKITDVSHAVWQDGAVLMMADEYFEEHRSKKVAKAQKDVEDILEAHGREMSSVDLRADLIRRGHTPRTIRRAMEGLNLDRHHAGSKQPGQHKVRLKTRMTS